MSTEEVSLSWRRIDAVGDDLVREREGHCSAIIRVPFTLRTTDASEARSAGAPGDGIDACDVVVVLGGYVEGSFDPDAIGATLPSRRHTALSPSRSQVTQRKCNGDRCDSVDGLRWVVLARDSVAFETDGATLVSDASRGGEQLFLFGGLDGDTYCPRNALYALSWVQGTTLMTGPELTQFSLSTTLVRCGGDVPSPRWRHAATSDKKNRMFVFGGATSDSNETNDLFVFHMITHVWTRIDHTDKGSPDSFVLGAVFLPALIAWQMTTWSTTEMTTKTTDGLSEDRLGVGSTSGPTDVAAAGAAAEDGSAEHVLVVLALYGGARFVDGVQSSVSDMFLLGICLSDSKDKRNSASPSATRLLGIKSVVTPDLDAAAASAEALPFVVPRVNGHVGVALPPACECVRAGTLSINNHTFHGLFLCGKDFDEGSDSVIELRVDAAATVGFPCNADGALEWWLHGVSASVVRHDKVDGGPHWRYTPSCVALDLTEAASSHGASFTDVLILGGQCRHPDPISVYALRVT